MQAAEAEAEAPTAAPAQEAEKCHHITDPIAVCQVLLANKVQVRHQLILELQLDQLVQAEAEAPEIMKVLQAAGFYLALVALVALAAVEQKQVALVALVALLVLMLALAALPLCSADRLTTSPDPVEAGAGALQAAVLGGPPPALIVRRAVLAEQP